MSCLLLFRRSCPGKKLHDNHNRPNLHNIRKAPWKFEQNPFKHWWEIKKVRYKILLPQKVNQKFSQKNLTKNSFRVKILRYQLTRCVNKLQTCNFLILKLLIYLYKLYSNGRFAHTSISQYNYLVFTHPGMSRTWHFTLK